MILQEEIDAFQVTIFGGYDKRRSTQRILPVYHSLQVCGTDTGQQSCQNGYITFCGAIMKRILFGLFYNSNTLKVNILKFYRYFKPQKYRSWHPRRLEPEPGQYRDP